MADIITDIKNAYKRGNAFIQLIFINVGVFFVTALVGVALMLFNRSASGFWELFQLPASFGRFIYQPWSIFTYMFMHADLLHILFNMLWLYWFGSLFLYFFSAKHLRGVYLLGGICGGLLYMISYNLFPYFAPMVDHSLMVGASASILAIVTAVAYREPNYPVRLLLFGTMKLKYLALFVVLTDLLFLTSSNAGGHIAHLGGALAGLFFAAMLQKGTDLTLWINKALDGLSPLLNKKNWKMKSKKSKPTMNVHYNRNPKDFDYNAQKKKQSEEIDRILDKIKKSGYENLTTEEKKSLFDASKK
ncbi:rhomboid family intramembrane serine protease [Bacteroides sp. 214]|uniref:rhomboid family intramembrane serine protease n=1 Tax=Bacteroides sp. 214 TaxID=2302935 RepID=UPI0013D1EF07|nr:rhomboid family intramembrane serine protease [Bacteroides sp. 214]NDW13547.1 rhomboid family intramembrane serine protease [Bacteroides sp. 214]